MEEFWDELLTAESWRKLRELSKKYAFIVIGGWAVFLWAKAQKSKDLDIMVDFKTLEALRQDYEMTKNERLKKYEIKFEKFDIDVYVKYWSKLAIPPNELETTKIDGIATVSAENLLVLKQSAEIDRRGTSKGKKDAIDILQLLLSKSVDLAKYRRTLETYDLDYEKELEVVIKNFDDRDLKYLNMNFKEFKDWRKEFLSSLKHKR